MNKIQNILLLGFSTFFILLLIILLQNQYLADEAKDSNKHLSNEINPAIISINELNNLSRENILLLSTLKSESFDIESQNRIKEIIEVEMPFALNNLVNVNTSNIQRGKLIDNIAYKVNAISNEVENYNTLLLSEIGENSNALKSVIDSISIKLIPNLTFELNNLCLELEILYNEELKMSQENLSTQLANMSNFILTTIIIGSVVGILLVFFITRSIVKPLKAMDQATRIIRKGNYDKKLKISFPKEFSDLSKSFNKMSSNLSYSFEEIERKNEELEQFVYITSHDLQEPLKTLIALSDNLVKINENKLDEKSENYIKYIKMSANRMSTMVSGLMEHSRLGKLSHIEEVDLNKILDEVKQDLKYSINSSYTSFNSPKLPIIYAYPLELHLLIQNILSNSIKFKAKDLSPHVDISYTEDANFYYFTFEDNGIGVNPKYKEKAFLMFQRLHSNKSIHGSGIGLAHCKKIVDLHHGEISIEGEVGMGTTIKFSIAKSLKKEE